jgi:serine/threonine protein kinase
MAVTLDQFVDFLAQSGLLSADEVSSYTDNLPPEKRPKDGHELAKALVRDGRLTKYQASIIYQGKQGSLVFGEYIVLDRIGVGGMGVVLKAQHRRMKRIVAIKVLPTAAMKNRDSVDRFHREVEAAAKLNHPNIVTAYDAGEHQGMHFLVMEFVDGRDLATIIKEAGPLSVPQAIDCIIQAAKGLEFAHALGIVHRDIKPGNLLLSRDGQIKILDMGLARFDDQPGFNAGDTDSQLTATGQIMGTVDYMSPEQARDTHSADQRSDIYSLGCTLYRLLTGDCPYEGDTMMIKLLAHREDPVPSLCDRRPDVPEALDEVFQRMMAKRPDDRYQSMSEVIVDLRACLGSDSPSERNVLDDSHAEDSALSDFFSRLGSSKVSTGSRPRFAAGDDTLPRQSDSTDPVLAEGEPLAGGRSERPSAIKALKKSPRLQFLVGALAGLICVGLLLFVLWRRGATPRGEDPDLTTPYAGDTIRP